eukprot:670602-Alexandrium_andersonii.AAC.1
MSASLVGSEMCIRDSSRTPNSKRSELALPKVQQRFRRSELELCGPRSSPVSYTHLTLPTICSV